MQINYFHQRNSLEIHSDSPKFLDFDYLKDQIITTNLINETFSTWINDVNDVKLGKYDTIQKAYSFTHFTKLAYMYVELMKDQKYKYPFLAGPSAEISGARMLVLCQYFPHLTWDKVQFKVNDNTSDNIDLLIESVLNNGYWKNRIKTFNLVRAAVKIEKLNDKIFYSVNEIDFVNQIPWIFSKDWTTGSDYLENYNYSQLSEKISRTMQLWNNMREIIKQYPTHTEDDYKRLLDIIVLDNIEFVKNWQKDFINT
jgi:hypothetical protein